MLWFGSALEPSEGRVTRFISLGLVAVINMLGVAAAPAMPLALLEQSQPWLITPVAGGCGPDGIAMPMACADPTSLRESWSRRAL